MAVSLLGTGHTRLKLLGNEIHTEKLRILRQLGFAAGMIFCAGLAILLAVALLVVLFWDQRVALLAGLTLLFAALGIFFYTSLRRSSEDAENLFAASLAELQEDLRQLKSAAATPAPAAHEKNPG
ncbi:hypothetical protein RD110_25225 [Rhodoferax koreense]|uniref:Phage holin family protein n=1 Tax=Rhodoferax koreensis TaxID=1842727 RepID=A0A1P8K284_9BURK|nr:phage holin family protein [Rhodoferax koreense]APW40099.1 hypothetical protein RD110_25225 [Rhodoferax koreense]